MHVVRLMITRSLLKVMAHTHTHIRGIGIIGCWSSHRAENESTRPPADKPTALPVRPDPNPDPGTISRTVL